MNMDLYSNTFAVHIFYAYFGWKWFETSFEMMLNNNNNPQIVSAYCVWHTIELYIKLFSP